MWPMVMVVVVEVVAVMVEVVVVVVVVVCCAGAGEWCCGGRTGRQQRGVLASVGASLACACGFVARGVWRVKRPAREGCNVDVCPRGGDLIVRKDSFTSGLVGTTRRGGSGGAAGPEC